MSATLFIDGGVDAGSPVDSGTPDAGSEVDSGTLDAGSSADSGILDAGSEVDSGTLDASSPVDSGTLDAGSLIDGGAMDADAGDVTDGGSTHEVNRYALGCSCAAPGEPLFGALALMLFWARRTGRARVSGLAASRRF